MSDQDHRKYPNIKDFAQKASFEIARVQLASVITKFEFFRLPQSPHGVTL